MTDDPYAREREFGGGIFDSSVASGRRQARIHATPTGIVARAEDGEEVRIAWQGMRIERGGASGDVVSCHAPHGRAAIFSEEPEFLRELESIGGNEVSDELARLAGERIATRRGHAIRWSIVLVLLVLVLGAIPRVFRKSIDGVVSALPYSVDEAIGKAVSETMEPGGKEVEDEQVRAAIQVMIDRLAAQLEDEHLSFEFRVIENDQVNAFALPGGYITVFTGLILEAERPEQVAGVLAHEIAHVMHRDGLRRIAHSIGVWVGIELILGDAEGLQAIAKKLFTLATVNDYSQDQEREADAEGVRLMIAARLDPHALAEFFELLERKYGDVPDPLSWLSTHPLYGERVSAIETQVDELASEESWEPLGVDWATVRGRL
ncbi:MAG: M48 family metallopeptidase [Planctomycetota bacterium]|nr:MAG: M48 family metallopeptidase [Planctomycetota bacterium]